MKKNLKVFSLILLSIIITFCFFGCNKSKKITTGAHFFTVAELWQFPYDAYIPEDKPTQTYYWNKIVLTNKEQVTDLFGTTRSIIWSDKENNFVQTHDFTNMINKFDDKYFETKQVLTFFATAAGGGCYFKLRDIVYQTGKLTVELNHIQGAGHDTLVAWFVIVEINTIPPDTQIEVKVLN